VKSLILKYVRRLARAQSDQGFFERLRDAANAGMNIGGGGDLATSGESQVFEHVRAHGGPAPVVLDVGANEGAYALAARRALGPGARILAFEPSSTAFARLEAAVDGSDIEALRLALGEEAGTATLYADRDASRLASLYAREIDHLDMRLQPVEEVPVARLDDVCAERGLDGDIALLKLDVEGHELAVLEGAASLLGRRAFARIQFEFGGCNVDSRTYFRDFFRRLTPGHRVFRILRRGFCEITGYRETHEVFTTTNFLAVHADVPPPVGVVES
jgi:FkbM family methyltransferase